MAAAAEAPQMASTVTRRDDRRAAAPGARVLRAPQAHPHRTAAGLLALLVLAYLWPALLAGRLLAPTALLYADPPWAALAPRGIARWMNGDLADPALLYYPWDVLARRLLHAGTFPAWNPYTFAGTPFLANFQLAWLSPFSLPLWLAPLNYGLGLAAALKLWTAGFGSYLLARELRLSFWPAMLAAVSFALGAFDVLWLSHGVFVSVAALLPWMVWLAERIVRRGRALDGFALAVVAVCAITGGHPGTQVHVFAATALYALLRVAVRPGGRRERLARLGLVGGVLALAALATAVLLLPANRAAAGTVGIAARRNGSPSYLSSMIPWHALRTALFPDWWGRPSEHVAAGPSTYRERTFYAGSVALLLAGVALVAPGAWRRKAPFAVLAVLGAAIAVRTPGLWDLVIRLPLFDQVQNGRILLWFTFAVPLLAAFGLQALLDDPGLVRRAAAVLGVGALAGLVAIASLRLSGRTIGDALATMVQRTDAGRPAAALSLASVGWWLVWVAAVAAVLAAWRRHRSRVPWLLGALVALLAALDVLHFAHGYQPMGPPAQTVPPRTPAIAYLQRHAGEGRIAGVVAHVEVGTWMLQPEWSLVFGLRDVRGYDVPQPTERFFRVWRLMGSDIVTPYENPIFTAASVHVLGVLGARWILAPPEARSAPPGVRLAYRGREARVFLNPGAASRAIVAAHVAAVSGEDGEVAAIRAARFDPRTDAVVRRDDAARVGAPVAGARGTARIVGERNARVTLRASLSRAGLVVLDDAWAPGWRVTVDGRPARPLRADVLVRAVAVPAGTHTVEWRYVVPGLREGALLSVVGVLLLLGWGGWLLVCARRRRTAPGGGTR
jgi:hypothetical protein